MPIQITDFEKYRAISGLCPSPDGKQLAYLVHKPDFNINGYQVQLYLHDLATSQQSVVASAPHPPIYFWRSEGLVYEQSRSIGRTDLCIRRNDGTVACWRSIPFCPTMTVCCGDELFALVPHGRDPEPPLPGLSVSPLDLCDIADEFPFIGNGRGFLSGQKNAIHRYRITDGTAVRLTDHSLDVELVRAYRDSVCFTARHVADGLGSPGLYCLGGEMVQQLIPPDHYRIMDLCEKEGEIVFVAQKNGCHCMTDNPQFYCYSGGNIEPLAHPELSYGSKINTDCIYGAPTPLLYQNGKLYFLESGEYSSYVSRLTPDGILTRLTADNGSVEGFCFAGDKLYFAGLRGQCLHELYCLDETGETCITSFNRDTVPEDSLASPERFQFASEDGYTVNYVVLPPANYDSAKQYPAILYIHGGAKTNYSTVFFHEMQYLAGQGYFVIYGNPHGSDGQDSEFARLKGHYFEQDYRDVMKAADVALERYPAIDPKRFAVVGGSYGGIMTNWIIGNTDRFACAVSQRSLCNMISAFGTADNGAGFVSEQMEGTPWDGMEHLWRQSPLRHANKVTTPLLLIHADEDYRCHFSEAMQMYTALRYHGVEARLCLIRGETHELSRKGKPAQRLLRLQEIVNWLNGHLMDNL